MRKIVVAAALMSLLSGGVAACSTPSSKADATNTDAASTPATTIKSVGEIKAAYFSAASSNTYLKAGIDSAEKYAKAKGFSLDVFDGQFNAQTQIDQIQSAITSGKYNAFAIEAMDGNLVCSSVKQAIAAKILVSSVGGAFCGLDSKPVEEMHMPGTVTIVNGQSLGVYQAWVEQVKKNHPKGAKIAIITGPSLSVYTAAMADAAKAFGAAEGYKVVANQATDYTTGQAFKAAETILQAHPDTDVIMSNFSGMSRGVLQATANTKVAVYDFGGDQWSLDQVKSGKLASTIMMLPRQETEYAFQAIVETVEGKSPKRVYDLSKDPSLPGGSPFVYKDNVSKFTAQY